MLALQLTLVNKVLNFAKENSLEILCYDLKK